MKLVEGMRGGDLEDLVLPLVSIDEYESKVDDNAIVVAFYVSDHDAANDLNRYIQKSPTPIVDTDVSPAPDQRGYYLVFAEFLNNTRIGENIHAIIDEVSPIANITNWKMRFRGVDRLIPFSLVAINKQFEQKDDVAESLKLFLQPTDIEKVSVANNDLVLEGYGYKDRYEIVAFGPLETVLSERSLMVHPEDVSIASNRAAARMDRQLGEGWSVSCVDGLNLVMHDYSDNALLIKRK